VLGIYKKLLRRRTTESIRRMSGIDALTDCIKGKDDHIQVLENQVLSIEAQVALLQLRNICLSEETEKK
jgi:hypothetical protein